MRRGQGTTGLHLVSGARIGSGRLSLPTLSMLLPLADSAGDLAPDGDQEDRPDACASRLVEEYHLGVCKGNHQVRIGSRVCNEVDPRGNGSPIVRVVP